MGRRSGDQVVGVATGESDGDDPALSSRLLLPLSSIVPPMRVVTPIGEATARRLPKQRVWRGAGSRSTEKLYPLPA
jgi:hypothetical protein